MPINIWAIIFLCYCCVWVPSPTMHPVTSETMNYAGPITVGIILIVLLDWFTTGKTRFRVRTPDFDNVEF